MMLIGTTSPTSVTHCTNVFGEATTTTTTTAAAVQNTIAKLHRIAFENFHAYMSDRAEETADE